MEKTNSTMEDVNPAISIITLNMNGINIDQKAEIIRLDKKQGTP